MNISITNKKNRMIQIDLSKSAERSFTWPTCYKYNLMGPIGCFIHSPNIGYNSWADITLKLCIGKASLWWATSSICSVGSSDATEGGFVKDLVTIVVLAAWYIGRVVADESEFVEYSAFSTATLFGVDTIVADVEGAAIFGVDVEGMVTVWDSSLGLALVSGTEETVS